MNTRKIKTVLRSERGQLLSILTTLFVAAFLFLWFAPVASAATLYEQTAYNATVALSTDGQKDIDGDWTGTAANVVLWLSCSAGDTLTATTTTADCGTTSTCVRIKNGGGAVIGWFSPTSNVTLSSGVNQVEFDNRISGTGDTSVWDEIMPIGGSDLGSNCVVEKQTTDAFAGSRMYASATHDLAFIVTDTGGITPPDPRPDPVTTIVAPTATTYGISGVPYRFASNVCLDDYASEEPYVRWQIQKDDGGWTDVASGSSEHFGFYVANGCDTGLAYGWGGIPNPVLSASFTTGDYRIRASSFFTGDISDEDDWGAWTSYVEFTYEASAYGGGGGGSWGGGAADSGDGSAEDWASFFDGVDSHDDLYGACKLFGLDFNFLGTGESEAGAGDGLPCLWTWVRYALIPPADATFNFVKRPFDALITRWPLTYITAPWQALTGAITEGGECPFPDFFDGSSGMFGALPTVEPCTWLDPVATLIDDNAFVSTALVMFLWCAVVALLIEEAFKFFES